MWPKKFIKEHEQVAKLLNKIKDQAFSFINQNPTCSEFDVQSFIQEKFDENELTSDYDPPIVAFGQNSALVHYFPKKKKARRLRENDVILIDLWAKFKNKKRSPFADITWVAFHGSKVPRKLRNIFDVVVSARDFGLDYIRSFLKKKKLPRGRDVFWAIKNHFRERRYEKEFPNFVGHPLGFFSSVHGKKRSLDPNSKREIYINQCYTLEPELDLKGKFGIRSEINFYIDPKYHLIVTTNLQKEIILV